MTPDPVKITVEGAPVPKARPRLGSGHVYTPTTAFENAVALVCKGSGYVGRFKRIPVVVSITFYGAKQTMDLDNLGKLYVDALVKAGVIEDDRLRWLKGLILLEGIGGAARAEIVVAAHA